MAIKPEFVQAMLDTYTFQLMENGIYIAAYTDMSARSHGCITNSQTFLELVQKDVTRKFGPYLDVKYFDPDAYDVLDDIQDRETFHLLVTLSPNHFYSKTVH